MTVRSNNNQQPLVTVVVVVERLTCSPTFCSLARFEFVSLQTTDDFKQQLHTDTTTI